MPSDWGSSPSQAVSNTQILQSVRYVREIGGGQAQIQEFMVGSGTTPQAGDWAAYDASGNIVQAGSGVTRLAGVAMKSGAASEFVPIQVAGPEAIFEMFCISSSASATGVRYAALSSQTPTTSATAGSARVRYLLGTATSIGRGTDSSFIFQVVRLLPGHSDSQSPNWLKAHVIAIRSDVGASV